MIHLCTCTGGSTSTISSTKRRGGSGIVSCKNCGGRPAIDGKSSSSCLLSTVLELTSLINSDFTWTKVSKGCRSSSRRPRSSNTNLSCGELLTNNSKELEMPVSESEKLGVSVLGCHFSEKAEHIPIKKRRFLFRASSPPRNTTTTSLEEAEIHGSNPKASSHGVQKNPNVTGLPATSVAVGGMCERGSNDNKLGEKELVKDDDFSGISILAAAACSNSLAAEPEVPSTVEFNENNMKSINICKQEPDSHTSMNPSKVVTSLNESMVDNSSLQAPLESAFSKTNQEACMNQKSSARDVRFSWDLNTVMETWEDPLVSEKEISTFDAATHNVEDKKNDYTKDNEFGSTSKSISNQKLPVELQNLAHEEQKLEMGTCRPNGHVEIREPLSREFDNVQHDSANDTIPVTRNLTLENPTTHGIFSKWANLPGQSYEAVDTQLSMDCSIPPGFDHCLNLHAFKENVTTTTTTATQTVKNTTSKSEYEKHDLSLTTATSLENGAHQRRVINIKVEDETMPKMESTSNVVVKEDSVNLPQEIEKGGSKVEVGDQTAAISSMHDAEVPLDHGVGYDNSHSDNRGGSGIDKLDEASVGYDSQYEDGELREYAWKGYEGENEYVKENRGDEDFNVGIVDANETSSQCVVQEGSSGILKLTDIGSGSGSGSGREADLISNVVVPEKQLHCGDEVSGSAPNEMISGQENGEKQDIVQQQDASQSDEWKMNVSGYDLLPENQRISSNNFTKTRTSFTGRKFSYRGQKDDFENEDVGMKSEGSRFYRKDPLTRIGGPTTRDVFLSRGRFQMQGCSSKAADGLTSRPERESGPLRSFGRGRCSPHRPTGRGGGMWNRSPERGRDQGPSFHRSMLDDVGTVDDMTNEGGMDSIHTGRPNTSSYVTRRPFRSRSPMNREANDFRARLGLRPTGDTSHERFVNLGRGRGRGRSVRYGTRLDGDGPGPRGRYHGPASDECDEFLTEYSHPFPRRRRCFSPIDRRGNHNYPDSRSPSRPRTRSPIANSGFRRRSSRSQSRSPNFRPDARMRSLRSPVYRRGFEPDHHPSEYNSGPRNNNNSSPPPSSRWVNYKERSAVFDRRSPPPQGRFSFHDSSRKPKQNEYYRSGHPGRFSDINEGGRGGRSRYLGHNDGDRPNNGYRRGGFVRRFNMDGNPKRFQYDDEDGFGRGFDARDKHALELHARGNLKPCSNSNGTTDSRFRDFPRRSRDDGESKRRSREGKDLSVNERDPKEESQHIRTKELKDHSTTTTNLDSTMANEVKEGDKP